VTNAIGSSAAITVSVARIVGPPTSSTAPGIRRARAARAGGRPVVLRIGVLHYPGIDRGTRCIVAMSVEQTARRELLMAMDVLDHHDRIVDQDADREDQREERHAIEREPPGPRGEQRRASVRITATPTIAASRRPSANQTSATTDSVANPSFWISFIALSLAVSP
jgi:hypothetical protein